VAQERLGEDELAGGQVDESAVDLRLAGALIEAEVAAAQDGRFGGGALGA
jgi:hypothetical protein